MNSNWIYRIFGSKRELSREDIERYRHTTDESDRHDIEMQSMASGFESDAMDGWADLNYNTSVMKKLDKKFSPTGNGFIIGAGILVIGALITGYVLFGHNTTLKEISVPEQDALLTLEEGQQMQFEESDLVLPQEIENMTEAPSHEQINAASIKSDFKVKKEDPDVEPFELDITDLPILDIQIEQEEFEKPIRKHFLAKEVYLHDLKLVDYREYRSQPTVKTKQIILTGIPASKENDSSEDFTQSTRDMEIPYVEFLDKSMRYFSKNSYKRALARYETILATYSDDVNANFYGGLCLFNLKEYDRAIQLFEKCVNGTYSNFDEEAIWLIAQCHEKKGDVDKAKEIYQKIADHKGFYAKQAQAKLK